MTRMGPGTALAATALRTAGMGRAGLSGSIRPSPTESDSFWHTRIGVSAGPAVRPCLSASGRSDSIRLNPTPSNSPDLMKSVEHCNCTMAGPATVAASFRDAIVKDDDAASQSDLATVKTNPNDCGGQHQLPSFFQWKTNVSIQSCFGGEACFCETKPNEDGRNLY